MMQEPTQAAHKFLRIWALASLLLLLGLTAFVLLVDPYGLYQWVARPDFNLKKPGLSRLQAEIKMAHARRAQADVILLGNSRAEIGFDPRAAVFENSGRRVYNLAIPGTGVDTALAQVRQLMAAAQRPKTVLLGVDFLDFLTLRRVGVPSSAAATAQPASGGFWQFDALFSLASVRDAIQTLRIQRESGAQSLTTEGFNPLQEYIILAHDEGYFSLFKQKEGQYAQRFGRATGQLKDGDFGQLAEIVALLAARDVEVKLVIYPYHAQILVLLEEAGLWPTFEAWKSRLLGLIGNVGLQHPSAHLSLTDFSGFGVVQCERIPLKGDHQTVTHGYWEGGHFKKELGDRMLAQMFESPEAAKLTGFGFPLLPGTVERNALRLRDERLSCLQSYPELFSAGRASMQAVVGAAKSR